MRDLHHIIPEVSNTTIHVAVTEKLGYRKLCARWMPKMLKITKRNGWVPHWFFSRYAQEGDEFLDSIVTGDEAWGFHHTPESKKVQAELMTWFKGLTADFYDSGIRKLVPRLNNCILTEADGTSPSVRMQYILKGPTTSTQIASPTSGSEVSHKHRQHHKIPQKHFQSTSRRIHGKLKL